MRVTSTSSSQCTKIESRCAFTLWSQGTRSSSTVVSFSRKNLIVRAASSTPKEKPAVAKFADSIGLPTDEGLFGFKPFSEVWCGRLAMMGFIVSIVEEILTGRGTLAQIGISGTPSLPLLIGLLSLFGIATGAGTVWTAVRIAGKKMSKREIERYRQFLGLQNEDDWKLEAKAMKQRGDFTTPGIDMAQIEQTKLSGMAADQVLGTPSGDAEVTEVPLASSSASAKQIEESMFSYDDLKYARSVELDNGRAAMLGFLVAVLVEAGTGKGIVLQIIMYLKWSGLLGAMSGF